MSAPLEKLLERVNESIEIVEKYQVWKYGKEVTPEEIVSSIKKSVDILQEKWLNNLTNHSVSYYYDRLSGFLEAIKYLTRTTSKSELTLYGLRNLARYLETKIEGLKSHNL